MAKPIAVIGTHVNKGGYYEMVVHEHKGDVVERRERWDRSGLKEASQRALKIGRTHQETDIQLFLNVLLEIERLEDEHAILTEQRDRLAQAIRDFRYRHRRIAEKSGFRDCACDDCIYFAPHLNAVDVTATVEQRGGESSNSEQSR